ncbi:hypothetical protein QJS10_CPA06g02149 [Acorus calamus]|uniref:Uncharacterized protein n=1 Tax=Acorus calamus TaxID=4465 RepID=A0AAV9ET04_ACOCL|nr:hypothetical protein QJS10_CPA06g02149 [Acorus calamus]
MTTSPNPSAVNTMEEESVKLAAEGLKRRSLARVAFSTHRLSSLTPGIPSALASPGRYHKTLKLVKKPFGIRQIVWLHEVDLDIEEEDTIEH